MFLQILLHYCPPAYLLLEIADGKFISECEKMSNAMLNVIVFQMIHHMGAITLQSKVVCTHLNSNAVWTEKQKVHAV